MEGFLDVQFRQIGARANQLKDRVSNLWDRVLTLSLPPEAMSPELQNRLTNMQSVYSVLWSIFNGDYWRQVDSGTNQDRWKVKMNWAQAACFIHSALWAGELPSNAEPIMRCRVEPKPSATGTIYNKAKDAADHASRVVNDIWSENFGRSMMIDANTLAQALGGVVFVLRYEPERLWWQRHPVRIEMVRPEHFVAIPNATNYWDLLKVWIVRQISREQAELAYDYTPAPHQRNSETVELAEMWTKKEYQVTIGGKVASLNGVPMRGENPFDFIPVVYIPHIRAGQLIGTPLIAQVIGILEEINEASQTLGDFISNSVNELPWVRDITGKASVMNFAGRQYLNLGVSHQYGTPEMNRLTTSEQVATVGPKYLDFLMASFKEIVQTPEVAWGVDPGSQRSGESRQLLFFPLEEHIKQERIFWGDGKSAADEMLLRMLKQIGGYKLTNEHIGLTKYQTWHPLMPPDREKLVTEYQLRAQAGLVGQETALQGLGDVEDVEQEMQRIDEFMQKRAAWQPVGLPGIDTPPPASAGNGNKKE